MFVGLVSSFILYARISLYHTLPALHTDSVRPYESPYITNIFVTVHGWRAAECIVVCVARSPAFIFHDSTWSSPGTVCELFSRCFCCMTCELWVLHTEIIRNMHLIKCKARNNKEAIPPSTSSSSLLLSLLPVIIIVVGGSLDLLAKCTCEWVWVNMSRCCWCISDRNVFPSYTVPQFDSVCAVSKVRGRLARDNKINRFARRCNIHSMQIYTDNCTSSAKLSFAQIFLCSIRGEFIA